jgi:hypothetical protein
MSILSLDYKMKRWEEGNDQIFERLKGKKDIIQVNPSLQKNSGSSGSSKGGTGGRCYSRDLFKFKHQKCDKCKYLYNHLAYHPEDKSVIHIPSGKRKGRDIEIISQEGKDEYKISKVSKDKNIEIGRKIYKFYKDEFFCITNVSYYCTTDALVNISVMMMILRLYSIKKNFPLFPDFLYFYNCTGTNFLIYLSQEFEGIENFNRDPNYNNSFSPVAQKRKGSEFSIDTVKDILFQTILSLKFYGNLFFTHNELDYTKLRFSSKPIHVQYNNKMYVSPFRCLIFPSGYSSICVYNSKEKWWSRFFLQRTRFSEDDRREIPIDELLIEMNGSTNYYTHDPEKMKEYFSPDKGSTYLKHRIMFYRLNKKCNYFLKLRREYGSVFLLNSFDAITMFCSLMTLPFFYDSLLSDPDLSRVWYGLWRKTEAESITELLINQQHPLNFDNTVQILKKFYIRFDAVEYLYRELDGL